MQKTLGKETEEWPAWAFRLFSLFWGGKRSTGRESLSSELTLLSLGGHPPSKAPRLVLPSRKPRPGFCVHPCLFLSSQALVSPALITNQSRPQCLGSFLPRHASVACLSVGEAIRPSMRIQNEQKKAAKREEALASFEAWKAMKEKEAKKIAAKKRLEEKNKKKTEEENAVRKGEALQAFEKWKEKKLEYLKEKTRREKESERAKKQKEEEAVAEKKKDSVTAFERWSEKKEALLKQKEKEKINERRKEELKRAEKKDKDKQAISEYEKWLEKKERQERIDRKQKKRHSFLESETHPPWSPPSRTAPSKVF